MASRVGQQILILPCLEATEQKRPAPALTSDLHEEIFLRVASAGDLARASAACVAFHRLVTDPAFLRRHRSIHPPLLLGFISSAGFQPAEPPHPSAAVARAADFSFDFVPRPTRLNHWHPCDVRDGHVLIDCRRFKDRGDGEERLCLDFAVSDPSSRRYLLLPPMTDELLASVGLQNHDVFNSGASFVPSGEIEDEASFSVMCWMHSETKFVVFFFSSDSSQWTIDL
nr:unnamed protein product [Digitaria exilis]